MLVTGITERVYQLRKQITISVFALIGLYHQFVYYLRITYGQTSLAWDFTGAYKPVADAVLRGVPLYTAPAIDNKPPLFFYIDILLAMTGFHALSFLLLIGLCNAAIAVGIYYYAKGFVSENVATLAGILFIVAVPAAHGHIINVRSLSLVLIMLGLFVNGTVRRGTTAAFAGLISQYSGLALIVYLIHDYATDELSLRKSVKMVATSVVVVGIGFLSLGIIWGPSAIQNGIEASVLAAGSYSTENNHGFFSNTLLWGGWVLYLLDDLLFVYILAPIGVITATDYGPQRKLAVVASGSSVILWLPIFVNNLAYYWMLPLPFISILAAIGIEKLLKNNPTS